MPRVRPSLPGWHFRKFLLLLYFYTMNYPKKPGFNLYQLRNSLEKRLFLVFWPFAAITAKFENSLLARARKMSYISAMRACSAITKCEKIWKTHSFFSAIKEKIYRKLRKKIISRLNLYSTVQKHRSNYPCALRNAQPQQWVHNWWRFCRHREIFQRNHYLEKSVEIIF